MCLISGHQNDEEKQDNDQSQNSYVESMRQTIGEWLAQAESSLANDSIQITFVATLEDKLSSLKEMLGELNEHKSQLDSIVKCKDKTSSSSSSSSSSSDRLLKSKCDKIEKCVKEHIGKLDTLISELKEFNETYVNLMCTSNQIDADLQVEHHHTQTNNKSSGSSAQQQQQHHATLTQCKTLEAQLANLKQVKVELERLHTDLDEYNYNYQKYLFSPLTEAKYLAKLKADTSVLNEKMAHLKSVYTKKLYNLEDALAKSAQIDSQIESIESWLNAKDQEILKDEGLIISEEQFDERTIKYKVCVHMCKERA